MCVRKIIDEGLLESGELMISNAYKIFSYS